MLLQLQQRISALEQKTADLDNWFFARGGRSVDTQYWHLCLCAPLWLICIKWILDIYGFFNPFLRQSLMTLEKLTPLPICLICSAWIIISLMASLSSSIMVTSFNMIKVLNYFLKSLLIFCQRRGQVLWQIECSRILFGSSLTVIQYVFSIFMVRV